MSLAQGIATPTRKYNWQTPLVLIICGSLIAMLTFGPRSSFGFFMGPMSIEFSWGRDVFALAFAIQNLLWGVGQPFVGAIADKFGPTRVISIGALMYAMGLVVMRYSDSILELNLGAGVLIGFGLAGCSFNIVLAALTKMVPESWRGLALGAGTAAGSFGQFLFAPFTVALIENTGWQSTLTVFAFLMMLVIPLSLALSLPKTKQVETIAAPRQSFRQALSEAFGHRSYVLLVIGFFTCGFQLAFITMHLPAYLVDRGMPASTGGWVIAIIGLFNIIGALTVGWLQHKYPKRYILSLIYAARAVSTVAFILLPMSTTSALAFGMVSGLTWLSTVPPTSALVSLMFGVRWLAALYGFAFFSHQVGGFLGAWLGGLLYEQLGSYTPVWWLSVFLGIFSALINLPIVEKPVVRESLQPA